MPVFRGEYDMYQQVGKRLRHGYRTSETPSGFFALGGSQTQGSRCAATLGYVVQALRATYVRAELCCSSPSGYLCPGRAMLFKPFGLPMPGTSRVVQAFRTTTAPA